MAKLTRPDGARIHYEVHGQGDPVLCMGGWGSFCHGELRGLPFGLVDRHRVVVLDYRGIGESTDDLDAAPSIAAFAEDAIAILDAEGLTNVHLLGMVGIGACIAQEIALRRPDLTRSLVNTGAWARADRMLADQLQLFLDVHREGGFLMFQRLVCAYSFEPDFYNANVERLLGYDGPWHHLHGRVGAHERFIVASLAHDRLDDLVRIDAPALIFHAPLDVVTGPRLTRPIEHALGNARGLTIDGAAHVLAGRAMRQTFVDHLYRFYDEV